MATSTKQLHRRTWIDREILWIACAGFTAIKVEAHFVGDPQATAKVLKIPHIATLGIKIPRQYPILLLKCLESGIVLPILWCTM